LAKNALPPGPNFQLANAGGHAILCFGVGRNATNQPRPATASSLWQPTKPASDYTDDEVLATPISFHLAKATGFPPRDNLPFCRQAIDQMWDKQRATRLAGPIAVLFEALDAAKEAGDSFVVNRDGSFKPVKKTAATAAEGGRVRNSDYAKFIGQGNTPLNPKAQHGGFVHEVSQARTTERNGTYELVILPGIKGNKVCEEMQAKLYQYPANGAKLPVICYPPLKGERPAHRKGESLRIDDDVIEVASMSQMMKMSALAQPQTPAVLFKLADLLRSQPATPVTAKDEDEDEDEDEANASAILDDTEFGSDD